MLKLYVDHGSDVPKPELGFYVCNNGSGSVTDPERAIGVNNNYATIDRSHYGIFSVPKFLRIDIPFVDIPIGKTLTVNVTTDFTQHDFHVGMSCQIGFSGYTTSTDVIFDPNYFFTNPPGPQGMLANIINPSNPGPGGGLVSFSKRTDSYSFVGGVNPMPGDCFVYFYTATSLFEPSPPPPVNTHNVIRVYNVFLSGDLFEDNIVDYTPYLSDFDINDSINQPTIATFKLEGWNKSFVPPMRSERLILKSLKYDKKIFTGFVVQTPELDFHGGRDDQHIYSYVIKCTSDEWLLNAKAVPFIPAMVNQTMGGVLRNLCDVLAPDFYDTTEIDDGDVVPIFYYNPQQTWSEIAKQFADSLRYHYKVLDKKITFKPYGDDVLGIRYNEVEDDSGLFDPFSLKTSVLQNQIVNDAIVIGDVEAHTIRQDFFIGNGFDGNFPLKHQVYQGAQNELLKDDWTESDFNTQYWTIEDPQGFFLLTDNVGQNIGALNIVGGESLGDGSNYILGVNGLELGGDWTLEHCEVIFFDNCKGFIGGLYTGFDDEGNLPQANLINAFSITGATTRFEASVSGSAGIVIQPVSLSGNPVGTAYETLLNHSYQLQTLIHSSQPVRYNRTFRSIDGDAVGGDEIESNIRVTWIITELVVGDPSSNHVVLQHVEEISAPSFCLYTLVNNEDLNVIINATSISRPPQGRLLLSGDITMSGSNGVGLPYITNPYPGLFPLQVVGKEVPYAMGFGFTNQVATIGIQGSHQILQFYSDSLPGVGVRIHLRTWEAKKSAGRVTNPTSISGEARVVGDDGRRTAIFTNFNPLPRTSEECELAASAILKDREDTIYNGSYVVPSMPYFKGFLVDYPIPGRFLEVSTSTRGVNDDFLVSSVTMKMVELQEEQITFTINFGHDQQLQKTLIKFLAPKTNVLTPNDATDQPTEIQLSELGTAYLDDLTDVQVTVIHSTFFNVDFGVTPLPGQVIEVRSSDFGWGPTSVKNLIVRTTQQTISLDRIAFDQVWFIRLVQTNG